MLNFSASVNANELLPVDVAPRITINFSRGEFVKRNDCTESKIFVKSNGSAANSFIAFLISRIVATNAKLVKRRIVALF